MKRAKPRRRKGRKAPTVTTIARKSRKAPSVATMMRWSDRGGCEATDGCWVEPDGTCPHGKPSWMLYLGYI